jgi:FMN-dependent NADH-azoreductase
MKGTLDKKLVTLFISAGRHFGPGSADAPRNHLEPWLRTFFSNLGVKDLRFVFADGTAEVRHGKIDPAAFLAPHIEAMQSFFA